MMTAFSIMQTMTIAPFQNLILNALDMALTEGGYADTELYFDQLTPLAILSQQAEDTGKSIGQVADETNKELENPSTTEEGEDQTTSDMIPPTQSNMSNEDLDFIRKVGTKSAFFKREFN
jgi:hypothetical protein